MEFVALGPGVSVKELGKTRPAEGRVIRASAAGLKQMSLEEAQTELDVADKEFIVFRNAETQAVSALYRRGDGNFGLIESGY